MDDEESDDEGEKEVLKFEDDSDEDDESDEEMNQMIKIQMNRLKRQGQGLELDSEDDDDDEEEEEDGGVDGKKKKKSSGDDKAGTWGGTKR